MIFNRLETDGRADGNQKMLPFNIVCTNAECRSGFLFLACLGSCILYGRQQKRTENHTDHEGEQFCEKVTEHESGSYTDGALKVYKTIETH